MTLVRFRSLQNLCSDRQLAGFTEESDSESLLKSEKQDYHKGFIHLNHPNVKSNSDKLIFKYF